MEDDTKPTKRIQMHVTCVVNIDVPDDAPVSPESLAAAARWKMDYRDGRWPYSGELVMDGAVRIAERALETVLFDHFQTVCGGNREARQKLDGMIRAVRTGSYIFASGDSPLRFRAELEDMT